MNRTVARWFGALLIATGLAGFVVPERKAITSGAPAYNVFHIVFGALGLAASRRTKTARVFNVGFGAIDLYQSLASWRRWWPLRHFRWRIADDILHSFIGPALVAIGSRKS